MKRWKRIKALGHLISFFTVWLGLLIWRGIVDNINWSIFKCLWFGFLVTNPDIDIVLQKIVRKFFRKSLHRWFLTHSILFSLFLYWLSRDYVNMVNAKEFGLCLFIPVIVHLVADFRIKNLMNKSKKDTAGYWQISTYPFKLNKVKGKMTYRLGDKGSIIFMIINVIFVIAYTIVIYID